MSVTFFHRCMAGSGVGLVLFVLFVFSSTFQGFEQGCLLILGVPAFVILFLLFLFARVLSKQIPFLFLLPLAGVGVLVLLAPPLGLGLLAIWVVAYILGFMATIWFLPVGSAITEMPPTRSDVSAEWGDTPPERLSIRHFVISAQQRGLSESEIKIRLQEAGWNEKDIQAALNLKR